MPMDVWMPLPHRDFDPTEAGVSFCALVDAGHNVIVATPEGNIAEADPRMALGNGLGPWRPMLMANRDGRNALARMVAHAAFQKPVPYAAMEPGRVDALVLPGGHAPGMKVYLESGAVQDAVTSVLGRNKPLGAICHGVLVAARARQGASGRSMLHGRRTTALTAWMELSAWSLTALWLGNYYRTYPQTVQAEVTAGLASPSDFLAGPYSTARDTPGNLTPGFVVRDNNYVSARWPGDAHRFAQTLVEMLRGG